MYFCCRVMVLDQQEYISKRNSISIDTLNIAWNFYVFDLSNIYSFEKLIDIYLRFCQQKHYNGKGERLLYKYMKIVIIRLIFILE